MRDLRVNGFTITELMIVVAILAILTGIAYPAFTESLLKSRRGDAQAALTGLASAMQRHHTESSPPTFVGAAASDPPSAPKSSIFPSQTPLDGAVKHYDLKIQTAAATVYTLRAAPISGSAQSGDKCGTLTLSSSGQRGITGAQSGVTWQNCWR